MAKVEIKGADKVLLSRESLAISAIINMNRQKFSDDVTIAKL